MALPHRPLAGNASVADVVAADRRIFSQEYDELYYEIYLGNHSGLVHWAWPGNMFRWNNLVAADLDFGNSRLRLGFRSNIYSTEVNHLTTRISIMPSW